MCYFIFRLIMFDLDPNPIVQLEPQTSSNVNIENPLAYSTSTGRKKRFKRTIKKLIETNV